jgi:hypothetical protein
MKYRFSILNVLCVVAIVLSIGFYFINYDKLNRDEGWGKMTLLINLFLLVLIFIVDILMQYFIASKNIFNIIQIVIASIYIILLIGAI